MDLVGIDLLKKDRTVVARRIGEESLVVHQGHRQIRRISFEEEILSTKHHFVVILTTDAKAKQGDLKDRNEKLKD